MLTKITLPYVTLEGPLLWNHPEGPRWGKTERERAEESLRGVRQKYAEGSVGFYDWPTQAAPELLGEIESVARRLREKFDRAVVFDIGGSHLGPDALLSAVRSPEDQEAFPIRWLSNVDPSAVEEIRAFIGGGRTAAVVVSKSGGTTETLSGFFHFSGELDPEGYVFITDPGTGFLRELAGARGWATLPVPPNIGGRYSVLTPVGLLPAALAGLPLAPLMAGAREMRDALEGYDPGENPAALLALAFERWDREAAASTQYLMPYWKNLRLFADWYVQLFGESLGKRTRHDREPVGFTPVAALGTTDQHSLLQLFKEGPRNKLIGFLDVVSASRTLVGEPPFPSGPLGYLTSHTFEEISHQACLATERSLNNSGVPTYRLTIGKPDLATLGALFFFFEAVCAIAGELYGVDAFDQPGVEEAKKLLKAALDR